ncbi:MAG: hypothetical protein ABIK28_14300 [Planctomycetota bacterium]
MNKRMIIILSILMLFAGLYALGIAQDRQIIVVPDAPPIAPLKGIAELPAVVAAVPSAVSSLVVVPPAIRGVNPEKPLDIEKLLRTEEACNDCDECEECEECDECDHECAEWVEECEDWDHECAEWEEACEDWDHDGSDWEEAFEEDCDNDGSDWEDVFDDCDECDECDELSDIDESLCEEWLLHEADESEDSYFDTGYFDELKLATLEQALAEKRAKLAEQHQRIASQHAEIAERARQVESKARSSELDWYKDAVEQYKVKAEKYRDAFPGKQGAAAKGYAFFTTEREGSKDSPEKELGRRIRCLQSAVESLESAGHSDDAADIAHKIEMLKRERDEMMRERQRQPARARARRGEPVDELHEAVEDLRSQVRELHDIVNELRHCVEGMQNKEEVRVDKLHILHEPRKPGKIALDGVYMLGESKDGRIKAEWVQPDNAFINENLDRVYEVGKSEDGRIRVEHLRPDRRTEKNRSDNVFMLKGKSGGKGSVRIIGEEGAHKQGGRILDLRSTAETIDI